jgi:tetratricopeptide (TPR) repeat protein
MDLISCLLHGRGIKKTAHLLSISPKTAEGHVRNIMLKIGCNSREGIIDYVEKSSKLVLLKKRYPKILKTFGSPEKKHSNSFLARITGIENNRKKEVTSVNPVSEKRLSEHIEKSEGQEKIVYEEPQLRQEKFPFSRKIVLKFLSQSQNKYIRRGIAGVAFFSLCFVILSFVHTKKMEFSFGVQSIKIAPFHPVRSEMILPHEEAFLKRSTLLKKMDKKFRTTKGIQSLALVGIGGAGKTTLAHQYALSQKLPIVWEINAETQETLQRSFEGLAYALSKTEENKKTLKELQEIKNLPEREEKILVFVKQQLKAHSGWLLIYDDVEQFSDIQKYFPHDLTMWGTGKIIITTRDSNVQNNSHIRDVLHIGELTQDQKTDLFLKILNKGDVNHLLFSQKEEIQQFLTKIPPFPLDVSLAAYYLKSTHVPYKQYLSRLNEMNEDFSIIQENVLKEASAYTKTRYSIVTLSLKHLLDRHKDFRYLLLFVSLLDSHDIPRDLLTLYKSDTVVDDFIHHLKKYSFIISVTSFSSLSPTLSIHRSVQDLSLHYLVKVLNLEKDVQPLKLMAHVLEEYVERGIKKEDISKLKIIVAHCERFLLHDSRLLNDNIKGQIKSKLGCIYYYLGNYVNAEKILKESMTYLNEKEGSNDLLLVQCLTYLGIVYKNLGDYEKAKNTLEQSLLILEKQPTENYSELAWVLANLGDVYKEIGNDTKAKGLLEQSLIIYREHSPQNYVGISRALSYLGVVYRNLGEYEKAKDSLEWGLEIYRNHVSKDNPRVARMLANLGKTYQHLENYRKAKDLLEQSLGIYRKHFTENHIDVAWILMHLGELYGSLSNYEQAQNLLEHSLSIYEKYFPKNHIDIARIHFYLGNIYKKQAHYKKAKNFLERSLKIHKKHYGNDHIETVRILRSLGIVYLTEGNLETAENLMIKALDSLHKSNSPEIYVILEDLAKLYLRKSFLAEYKGDLQQSQAFKNKAFEFLTQALGIVEVHFSESYPHIPRNQE